MRVRNGVGAIVAMAALWFVAPPREARAFCGFYVDDGGAKLFNDATMVVMMREGTRTVLSMQNSYAGPPEDFAMVVPVPVVLAEENVKTLPREIFERVDKLAAPRLVEYWEADPCATPLMGHGSGAGTGSGYGRGSGLESTVSPAPLVVVEAEFTVAEYEIVILSAKDATALEAWLREKGYAIPPGAEPYLRPYVTEGSKFFVAKVDIDKVAMKDGRALLSPLRFHYDTPDFGLPIRLGLINSAGTQDLIVHILSREGRFEAANYDNVFIPTNLDVSEAARGAFGPFYVALFDATLAKSPGAVVTEYAWSASSCDPCPVEPLDRSELATLGADVLPVAGLGPGLSGTGPGPRPAGSGGGASAGFGRVTPTGPLVRLALTVAKGGLDPAIVTRVAKRHLNEIKYCYEKELLTSPALAGKLRMDFTVTPEGKVADAKAHDSTVGKVIEACVTTRLTTWEFPGLKTATTVALPIHFSPTGGPPLPGRPPFVADAGFTLTRLHVRYAKDALGEDLVFRKAAPMTGGREVYAAPGKLEKGAIASLSDNNFQARYAIRHPWAGTIECKDPRRGVWGAAPAAAAGDPSKAEAAVGLAHVPRGTISLASLLLESVPSLSIEPEPAGTAGAGSAAGSAGAAAAPGGEGAAGSGAAATGGAGATEGGGGCACGVIGRAGARDAGAGGGGSTGAALLAFAVLTFVRRRSAKER